MKDPEVTHMLDSQERYDRSYRDRGMSAQRLYPNEEFLRFMGRHYFHLPRQNRKDVSILEIGCGTGANLWMLAAEGFDARGIDFSPEAINLCSETMSKWKVKFEANVGNILSLGYPDREFDVVADVFSVTHMSFAQHEEAYREANRVLRPQGKFFSYHPSDRSYSFLHGGGEMHDPHTVTNIVNEKAPYRGNGLMCFLSPEDCRGLLEKAGFNEIKIERIGRTYEDGGIYFEFLSIEGSKV